MRFLITAPAIALLSALAFGAPSQASDFYSPDEQLRDWIEELLGENAAIQVAALDEQVWAAAIDGQRALPDPTVNYRLFLQSPETRVGPQRQSVDIQQKFPWRGKRSLQGDRVAKMAEAARRGADSVAREQVLELKRAYFDAQYALIALDINEEESELLSRLEQVALQRYATGQGSQPEVLQIQSARTRLEEMRAQHEERLHRLQHRIAMLLDRPEQPVHIRPTELALPPEPQPQSELEKSAAENHPTLDATAMRIEAMRIEKRRNGMDALPDFSVGLNYTQVDPRSDAPGRINPPSGNGQDILGVGVQLTIPLFGKKNRSSVAQADARLQKERRQLERERVHLNHRLHDAWLRLTSARERAELFREVLIPQAQETLTAAEAAYTNNRLDFLALLDAQRILLRLRLDHRRRIADAWIATAELESVAAQPVPQAEGTGS